MDGSGRVARHAKKESIWLAHMFEWRHEVIVLVTNSLLASINQTPWGGSTFEPLYSVRDIGDVADRTA